MTGSGLFFFVASDTENAEEKKHAQIIKKKAA
jgi:hypothetical protein